MISTREGQGKDKEEKGTSMGGRRKGGEKGKKGAKTPALNVNAQCYNSN